MTVTMTEKNNMDIYRWCEALSVRLAVSLSCSNRKYPSQLFEVNKDVRGAEVRAELGVIGMALISPTH